MLTPQLLTDHTVYTAQRHWTFWLHIGFTLLFGGATVVALIEIARTQFPYPDLNLITIIGSVGTVVTLMIAWTLVGQTASIQMGADSFAVRKYGQTTFEYSYTTVIGHTVRQNTDKNSNWTELVVYLPDNWFVLRSIDFDDFDELVALFSAVSPVVAYRQVLSPGEQRLARIFLIVALLAGLTPVWFGFAAYQPVDKQPAQLVQLSGTLASIRKTTSRSKPYTGFALRLAQYPSFTFYARRNAFTDSLQTLPYSLNYPPRLTLTIRAYDRRTKISRQQPLTFGDKYDDYNSIPVAGIDSSPFFRVRTTKIVYNDSHTKPYLRLGLFCLYAIVIWSFWLAVNEQTIRR